MAEGKDDRREELLKEYDTLRVEILQKMSLENTLVTFTITTVVAILTFGLSQNKPMNPYFFLLPFCIIIPVSAQMADCRESCSKMGAYIIVYIESEIGGLNWETRNSQISSDLLKANFSKWSYFMNRCKYLSCFVLSVACYFIFAASYWATINCTFSGFFKEILPTASGWKHVLHLGLPIVCVIIVFYLTTQVGYYHKCRLSWKDIWDKQSENI